MLKGGEGKGGKELKTFGALVDRGEDCDELTGFVE